MMSWLASLLLVTPAAIALPLVSPVIPVAAVQQQDLSQKDLLVVPGTRLGPVTANTSRQQLAQIYGETNLKDGQIPVGEGFTELGTIVAQGTDHQFTLLWLNQQRTKPLLAQDLGPAWKTPEGVGVDLPYTDLQAILGKFEVYGFEWDYGGTVSLEGSNLRKYARQLFLRLVADPAAIVSHPQAYRAVMGDRLFASTDPNLACLNMKVKTMIVYLNSPPQ
ncbi:MAG: hypothetical protein ACOYMP_06635 [Nodosilinea sp.]